MDGLDISNVTYSCSNTGRWEYRVNQTETIIYPKSIQDLHNVVGKKNKISIVGAGKSMGGQSFFKDSLQINMSYLNNILKYKNN